jgi:hypothetical protein
MFSNMATIFKNYQNTGYILGPQYSFEYQDCSNNTNNINCSVGNISSLPLNTFKSKIIIMIDKQNKEISLKLSPRIAELFYADGCVGDQGFALLHLQKQPAKDHRGFYILCHNL